ncbi:MAG TPA: YbaK/EbsC family protein [Candidatus Limnocylindrales bacterium]|nr:YbaK/EbsC family protein [Candidatus Limnocylindrales bacterium]
MAQRGASEVKAFFEARGLVKEIRFFEESTHNSELAAQTLGVKVGQIAKTILLIVDESPVIAVISGDKRVDFKKVKALRGGKKVRLGGPEDVVAHTGFKVGAVSPVALPENIPIYQDRSLRRFETIYPAAGETNNMFVTTPGELLALTGAQEGDLARASD